MFHTFAKVQYYNRTVVAYLPKDLIDYYYALIPKYKNAQRQKYPPHITIVRGPYEPDVNRDKWKYRDGELISVYYDGVIKYSDTYFWIDCYSNDISEIRNELGLLQYPFIFNSYHFTIGNVKNEVAPK